MSVELWLAFAATSTVISLIPGPSVLMVVGQALGRGRRAAFWCILGNVVGGSVLITLSLLGVGTILTASAALFQVVKWAGVLYMTWLGWIRIREARRARLPSLPDAERGDSLASARAGFLVGVLNPKAIVFHVAFLAQFLDPAANVVLQFAILSATSAVVVGGVLGAYALLADRARRYLRSERMRRRVDYASGGFLIGGSAVMAFTR